MLIINNWTVDVYALVKLSIREEVDAEHTSRSSPHLINLVKSHRSIDRCLSDFSSGQPLDTHDLQKFTIYPE